MPARQYYLSILGLLPTLAVFAFIAARTLESSKRRPGRLLVWRVAVTTAAALITLNVLIELRAAPWMPRVASASVEALVNLSGLVGVAGVAAWLLPRALSRALPVTFRPDRRVALKAITGMGIAAPVGFAGFGVFVERTNFEVCETSVILRNLPPDFEGVRLLQLTDIHLSPYLSERTLAKVIDCSNELKPDFAFITGDLITAKGDPLDACLKQLARLDSHIPRLGCLGNHEVYADAVDYTVKQGAKLGIEFLRSQSRTVQAGGALMNVVGVDYQPIGSRSRYLNNVASMIHPGAVNLLLSHNPDVFSVAAAQGYDLTLAGHTHGGQVTFEMLSPTLNPARMLTPFVRGLYREGDRTCYVSRGIGTLGVPARLGARPEITLLTLKRA
jgi:predicted MPP superfamily phosphohydrolase